MSAADSLGWLVLKHKNHGLWFCVSVMRESESDAARAFLDQLASEPQKPL